jgi:hypothetical protein
VDVPVLGREDEFAFEGGFGGGSGEGENGCKECEQARQ